jgi:hypothetical protein
MNKASKFVVDAIPFLEKKFDAQEKLEQYRLDCRPRLQFHSQGNFEVTDKGTLHVVGGEYSSTEALRIAKWLVATFGE